MLGFGRQPLLLRGEQLDLLWQPLTVRAAPFATYSRMSLTDMPVARGRPPT